MFKQVAEVSPGRGLLGLQQGEPCTMEAKMRVEAGKTGLDVVWFSGMRK